MTTSRNYKTIALNKIAIENRTHVISKLKTGDLIKVKADLSPLIYHYGIIERNQEGLFIWHNHPSKKNQDGGNVIKEPLEEWIKGRDIISYQNTGIDIADINTMYEAIKEHKYDFINFNCEHFVNFASSKKYVSGQVIKLTGIALLGILVYYLIKTKRI